MLTKELAPQRNKLLRNFNTRNLSYNLGRVAQIWSAVETFWPLTSVFVDIKHTDLCA